MLDKIYKNRNHYFNEGNDDNGNKKRFPPQQIFRKFVTDTILEYSTFSSLTGFISKLGELAWVVNYHLF